VKKGDTADWLASCFGITLEALGKANDLKPPNYTIYKGQELLIPSLPGRVMSEEERKAAAIVDMHNEALRDFLLEPTLDNLNRLKELTADSSALQKDLWFADHLRKLLGGDPTCVSYIYFHPPEAVLTGTAEADVYSSEKWIYERHKGQLGIDRISDEFSVFGYDLRKVKGLWHLVEMTSSLRAKSRGWVKESACN